MSTIDDVVSFSDIELDETELYSPISNLSDVMDSVDVSNDVMDSVDVSNDSVVGDVGGNMSESFIDSVVGDVMDSVDLSGVDSVGTSIHKKSKFHWEKMNSKWENILLSDKFYVKDTLPDGNCQFKAISDALKNNKEIYTPKQLRKLIGDHMLNLSNNDFQEILTNYKLEKDNNEFIGGWDPYSIKKVKQLAKEVKKMGFHYEGDYTTLSLLSTILSLDFILFNEINDEYSISYINNGNSRVLILNYVKHKNSGHYKTIGIKINKKIETVFVLDEFPVVLSNIINKEIFYKLHIEHIREGTLTANQSESLQREGADNFTCVNVINTLNKILTDIPIKDNKLICRILAQIVNSESNLEMSFSNLNLNTSFSN